MRWPTPSRIEDWDLASSAQWRSIRVHLNDGLISAAGIIQGLTSAGATGGEALIAGVATTIVGGIVVMGAEYNEAAGDAASHRAIVEAERHRLELSPAEEFEELVTIYRNKGLSEPVARQVATELSAKDALAAQLDAEYGIPSLEPSISPGRLGFQFGGAFMVGSLLPLLLLVISERLTREIVVFLVVGIALTVSAILGARSDRTNPGFAVARTLAIGLGSMLISLIAGSLLSF